VNAARTAAIAAQAVRFGQAKRPTRIPKAHPPTLIETDFAAAMVAMVAEWRALAQPLIDDYNRRTDDTRRARTKLNTVRAAVQSSIRRAPTVAERSAKRTVQHSKAQVARQTKAALGIEVPTFPPGIDKRVEGFIQENAAAVQRLGNATVDQMEATLARAFTEGWSDAEVAEELIRRFAMTEKHARSLARDQIQRLYSQVTRMQHHELGVAVFRWMTRDDARVRHSHAVKHGKLFPYKGSRAPSFFPGDEINCRCWEEPVLEEIKASVRALAGKGRRR
jgi:SPP1 gp7 family putative phage head morphogenesis protein